MSIQDFIHNPKKNEDSVPSIDESAALMFMERRRIGPL
jgi:hypothetical protein